MPAQAPAPDPSDPTAPPAEPEPPPPDPADPPEPKRDERGLGGRGRFRGASEILAGEPGTTPTQSRAPDDTKRKGRAFSLHPDIVKRMQDTALKRADLILMAAERYGDQVQHIPRHNLPGRTTIVVRLTDAEHSRLQRIAKRRHWSLSSTVSALLELYLTEIETARNKTSKRARAKP